MAALVCAETCIPLTMTKRARSGLSLSTVQLCMIEFACDPPTREFCSPRRMGRWKEGRKQLTSFLSGSLTPCFQCVTIILAVHNYGRGMDKRKTHKMAFGVAFPFLSRHGHRTACRSAWMEHRRASKRTKNVKMQDWVFLSTEHLPRVQR